MVGSARCASAMVNASALAAARRSAHSGGRVLVVRRGKEWKDGKRMTRAYKEKTDTQTPAHLWPMSAMTKENRDFRQRRDDPDRFAESPREGIEGFHLHGKSAVADFS